MSEPFKRLIQIMSDLRNPDSGCPWDLEQTHNSLKGALPEETYELLEEGIEVATIPWVDKSEN